MYKIPETLDLNTLKGSVVEQVSFLSNTITIRCSEPYLDLFIYEEFIIEVEKAWFIYRDTKKYIATIDRGIDGLKGIPNYLVGLIGKKIESMSTDLARMDLRIHFSNNRTL